MILSDTEKLTVHGNTDNGRDFLRTGLGGFILII